MGKRQEQRRRSRDRSAESGEGFRTVRLQELIREEVSSVFDGEIGDARLDGVLITFVELTADGSCARLWYSAPEGREPLEALDRTAGFLRSRLAALYSGETGFDVYARAVSDAYQDQFGEGTTNVPDWTRGTARVQLYQFSR